jgi:hypothetical protein
MFLSLQCLMLLFIGTFTLMFYCFHRYWCILSNIWWRIKDGEYIYKIYPRCKGAHPSSLPSYTIVDRHIFALDKNLFFFVNIKVRRVSYLFNRCIWYIYIYIYLVRWIRIIFVIIVEILIVCIDQKKSKFTKSNNK